jgi:hypothetical protein
MIGLEGKRKLKGAGARAEVADAFTAERAAADGGTR